MTYKITSQSLDSLSWDWGGKGQQDERQRPNPYTPTEDRLPFSGLQIQTFLKDNIASLNSGKIGYISYSDGILRFYDKLTSGSLIGSASVANGITVLGYYATLEELQTAHPTGSVGQSYVVGSNLYIWSGSQWISTGAVRGSKGDDGFSPSVQASKSGSVTTITIVNQTGSSSVQINDGTSVEITKANIEAVFTGSITSHTHPSDTTKQDVISDLGTIRLGATLGSTAVQPAAISDMATKTFVASQYATTASVYTKGNVDTLLAEKAGTGSIEAIETKIPEQASAQNQLADKNFVNSSINSVTAYYIASDATGSAFATKAALLAGPHYSAGESRVPTKNDYALVLSDETQGNGSVRYIYDSLQWVFQYKVNDTPLTAAQVAAINSGITSNLVTSISQKYVKPDGGIPKTDLASGVQESLGKADSALQSYTETDPVFVASAAHGISASDISNWNAKGTYSKPSDGIPSSDMASAVQTSLGKADSVLQSKADVEGVLTGEISTHTHAHDSTKQDVIQVSTLPVAVQAMRGKVLQYIGITQGTLVNGAFYKCVYVDNSHIDSVETVPPGLISNVKINAEVFRSYVSGLPGNIPEICNLYYDSMTWQLVSGGQMPDTEDPTNFGLTYDGEIGTDHTVDIVYTSAPPAYSWQRISFVSSDDVSGVLPSAVQSLSSAEKTQVRESLAAYSKPSGGIPDTDLTSTIQSTLQSVSGKENSSNKVTSVTAGSTDTQYPSAKCLYDALQLLQLQHTSYTASSNAITFAPTNFREYGKASISANTSLTINLPNGNDHYLLLNNTGSSTVSVGVTGSLGESIVGGEGIEVEAGKMCELSVVKDNNIYIVTYFNFE